MSFGRIKTRLIALINRKDFTPELAGDFVLDAVTDLERQLRIGPMEAVLDKSDWDGTRNAFPIPSNYIETIRFFDDDRTYDEVSLDSYLGISEVEAQCRSRGVYTKIADRWLIKPTPPEGKRIYLQYYGETARPSLDSESSVWTEACFLATLYKAAELAADFYQMEPDVVGTYRTKATEHISKIAEQALDEAWSGRLSIPPPEGVGTY